MADKDEKPSTYEKVGKGFGSAFRSAGPVIVVLALGGLGIYFVYQWLMQGFFGGGQQFVDLYKSQLDAYMKKMIAFSKDTNGNLTAAQMQAHKDELDAMKQTQVNIANSYGQFNSIITTFTEYALIIATVLLLPTVISKWKPLFGRSSSQQPQSCESQIAMVDMMLADELAAEGYQTEATNFVTSIQNYYNSTAIPNMQTEIINYQTMINAGVLSGFELLYAQYQVAALSFDIDLLPTIWAMPF
jgi:hypothetical protein